MELVVRHYVHVVLCTDVSHGLGKRDGHYTGGCGLSLPSMEWIICPFSESDRRAERSQEAVTSNCALGSQSV